jgi:hypothetical protein
MSDRQDHAAIRVERLTTGGDVALVRRRVRLGP